MKMIQTDRVRSFRFWNKATPMTAKSQTVAQMIKVVAPLTTAKTQAINVLTTAENERLAIVYREAAQTEWENN